jgi:hypothetical protein
MSKWNKAQRDRDSSKGIERYEIRCLNKDKPLVRFFANWTMKHTLTLYELKRILDRGKRD